MANNAILVIGVAEIILFPITSVVTIAADTKIVIRWRQRSMAVFTRGCRVVFKGQFAPAQTIVASRTFSHIVIGRR